MERRGCSADESLTPALSLPESVSVMVDDKEEGSEVQPIPVTVLSGRKRRKKKKEEKKKDPVRIADYFDFELPEVDQHSDVDAAVQQWEQDFESRMGSKMRKRLESILDDRTQAHKHRDIRQSEWFKNHPASSKESSLLSNLLCDLSDGELDNLCDPNSDLSLSSSEDGRMHYDRITCDIPMIHSTVERTAMKRKFTEMKKTDDQNNSVDSCIKDEIQSQIQSSMSDESPSSEIDKDSNKGDTTIIKVESITVESNSSAQSDPLLTDALPISKPAVSSEPSVMTHPSNPDLPRPPDKEPFLAKVNRLRMEEMTSLCTKWIAHGDCPVNSRSKVAACLRVHPPEFGRKIAHLCRHLFKPGGCRFTKRHFGIVTDDGSNCPFSHDTKSQPCGRYYDLDRSLYNRESERNRNNNRHSGDLFDFLSNNSCESGKMGAHSAEDKEETDPKGCRFGDQCYFSHSMTKDEVRQFCEQRKLIDEAKELLALDNHTEQTESEFHQRWLAQMKEEQKERESTQNQTLKHRNEEMMSNHKNQDLDNLAKRLGDILAL